MNVLKSLAFYGGSKTVTKPLPHFDWGNPTSDQTKALAHYIDNKGAMSIYGDNGIYRALEKKIEEKYGVKYCILTNTGTSALNSGYFGIKVNPGDEVIVPSYTFLATVTPLLRLGATPVFADSDPLTGNISPKDIERKITNSTVAVAITHMWGVPCEMNEIMRIKKRYGLKLLEDCSHAHFTMYKGKLLGTFGDVACFSIGAKKTWTSGEGGFLITNDPECFVRATFLGHFEMRAKDALNRIRENGFIKIFDKYSNFISGYGENYRMHPYSAVMALAFLEKDFSDVIEKRKESLKYLTKKLGSVRGIEIPFFSDDFFTGAMYGYKPRIQVKKLNIKISFKKLISIIQAENIKIKLPDSLPLHKNLLFTSKKNLYYNKGNGFLAVKIKGDFSGVNNYFSGRVSLPTFSGGLKKDKDIIDQYCIGLNKVLSIADKLK